ncbi:hypothetical protein [Aquimarina sp. SS2-1]|uniref:hypothetical protein n=1 Tax=Aquimarina besae TaxID=3342247 RepID=UPI00366E6082
MKASNFIFFLIIIAFWNLSCEREIPTFPTINYVPCDDINVVADPNIVTDFECQSNVIIENVEVVRNPLETGINTSRFVGKYLDGIAADDALTFNFSGIDLSTNGVFKMIIKSSVAAEVKVILSGGSSDPIEAITVLNGENTWAVYEFNFSNEDSGDYSMVRIFFNEGITSDGTDLFYLDNLVFDVSVFAPDPCEGVTEDPSVINDFDCQENYEFGTPDDPVVEKIPNPDPSGSNTSTFVGSYIDNGQEPFDALIIEFGQPIDLSLTPQFSIQVWAPMQGNIIAKLEGGTAIERSVQVQNVREWQQHTFDFSDALNAGNTTLVLFFNAGATNGTTEDVYYIDDLKFINIPDPCEGVVPDLSIISDFECQQNVMLGLDPMVDAAPVVDNPEIDPQNSSVSVGQYTDDGTDRFDALIINFEDPIDLSVNSVFNIKVYSERQMPLTAKLEGGTPVELSTTVDVINEWKNYTFDFGGAIGNGNTQLTIFFNAGQADGTITDTYYIDDLRFTSQECPVEQLDCSTVMTDLSIINDFDCQQNMQIGLTEQSVPVVANPNISCENRSPNVGEYIANGTEAFDALITDFGTAIDLSVENQLQLKILTERAVPLVAKIEGGTQPYETPPITIDTVGEWATYTFDLSPGAGNGNTTLVLFFNFAQADGTTTDLYYLDDIRFVAP